MSVANTLLLDVLERIKSGVHVVVDGLTEEQLTYRIEGRSNSIAWLIWHLTRIQDQFVSRATDEEQIWLSESWVGRFGFPFDSASTGFGHTSAEVAAVTVDSGNLLTRYYDATHEHSVSFIRELAEPDYGRIIDATTTPPLTLSTHLAIMISGDSQHLGQAAYLRGLLPKTD